MIKYQKLVGLLMVVAIVCSLVPIVAAPVSAYVTAVTVTPTPATADTVAGYSESPHSKLWGILRFSDMRSHWELHT